MYLFINILALIGILSIAILYWRCRNSEEGKEDETGYQKIEEKVVKVISISEAKPKRKYNKKPVVAEKRPVGRPRKTIE